MDVITKFLNSISYRFPKGYPDMKDEQDVSLLENIIKEYIGEDLELIDEVSLSPVQLEKPFPSRSESATKYKDRGELFLEKILNGDEIELEDGSKVVINPEKSSEGVKFLQSKQYKSLGGTKKLFIDTEGNEFSLSKFKKTTEFGSGSGQGGGSVNTALAESSQCVFTALAYKVKNGPISEEDINDENLSKAFADSDVTNSLEEIKQFSQDPSWLNTFISSANILYKNIQNPNFQFHRGSKFVTNIYNAYKIAAKTEGISMQSDKWNPADIWLVDSSILNFQFSTTLSELNAEILTLFTDNKLVGVSLKKVGKEASLSLVNVSPQDKKGYTVEDVSAKLSNKGSQINYDQGKIYFRTFNFATNFAGEIMGKTAAHGKIGTGAINDVLKYNNVPALPNSKDIKLGFESKDSELLNTFYANYSKVDGELNQKEFNDFIANKDIDYLVSKYMALYIASVVKTSPIGNEIVSDMLRYASSTTKSSSAFAKVS